MNQVVGTSVFLVHFHCRAFSIFFFFLVHFHCRDCSIFFNFFFASTKTHISKLLFSPLDVFKHIFYFCSLICVLCFCLIAFLCFLVLLMLFCAFGTFLCCWRLLVLFVAFWFVQNHFVKNK